MEYHSQRLLAESMDQNLLIWLLGINHTSPGGAPSMNAETAATFFDVMTKECGAYDYCKGGIGASNGASSWTRRVGRRGTVVEVPYEATAQHGTQNPTMTLTLLDDSYSQ